MRRVILESPYSAPTESGIERNIIYARLCINDCLKRGESPIASHLLFTQPGILDDNNPAERILGIEAGLAWVNVADATVVYTDLGISDGMLLGINAATRCGAIVEYRTMGRSKLKLMSGADPKAEKELDNGQPAC